VATARACLSRLIARSTVLRFLYCSSSKPGGRPPREPLRRRAAWLSAFSGMVCRMPRSRRYWRQGPLLHALSAVTLRGLLRGLPGPRRGTWIFSSTAVNWVQSARCPGVTIRDSGRQRPSTLRWTLVVKPPRERPRPSPGAPPPPGGGAGSATAFRADVLSRRPPLMHGWVVGRAPAACWWARTMVESTEMSQSISPAASAAAWTCCSRRPMSISRPQPVPFVDRFPRPEAFGQVTPLHPGPYPIQDAVDHLAVVPPPATLAVAHRQERPQPVPRLVRQVPAHSHAAENEFFCLISTTYAR
jgi:hypothetical protein